jgi:PAS domain S-box-containing protein
VNPAFLTDPHTEARHFVRRSAFAISAVTCLLGALLVGSNASTPVLERSVLALGFVAMALFALFARRLSGAAAEWSLVAICLAGLGLIAVNALVNGWGLSAPGTAFFAVFSFFLAATVSMRLALAVGLACAAVLFGLAWAEHAGGIRGAAALRDMPVGRRLANQLLLLGVSLTAGLLVTRVFDHYLRAGRDRELRFQSLLGIAADAYWEMDAGYVVTTVWHRQGGDHSFPAAPRPQRQPWDNPDLHFDADELTRHRADLAAHRPFRDLHVRRRLACGQFCHELVSGEPRVDASGRFLGYWGVSRDITERVAATEALRRSETMLSHLVTTSPDLITLTDLATGRYVMVNEAFTRFSGYSCAEAVGRTSLELGVWGEPGARDDFIRRLRADGSVRDLPMQFAARDGTRFSLRVSAASFELEGDLYLVLNGRDVTATELTRLAHEAVLENASIGIALTRERRFMQANPTLEKMLGWERGTLVGQEGRIVWKDDAEYAEVGALIAPPLARGEQVEFVREMRRRDASLFWCRMLAKAVDPAHPMAGGTIWIVEDITERRRVEQALAKARDDAEAANRAKSAFLANTSHEIRTPLNGVVGLARLARRPGLDEARRSQYLDQIAASAETLSAVISDVLDLSKIEAGKLVIERVGFDLHALLESLRQVYATLADARGLGFTLQVDAGVPDWVWGDPVRVRQVLGNFLNNALKFTAEGGLSLHAGASGGDTLRFEVRDTGPGIAPEVQAQLFRPFTQADQSTTRRFGGSGLGLSICLELATLMRGRVGVDSEPGRGSRFWAELPLPRSDERAPESGFGTLAAPSLAGARVLMVEDNSVNMTIAVAMLEQWGVAVEEAHDGALAIVAVEQAARAGRPFDLVLMDVQMPVMSGYEATRRLRALPAGQALPIIALTAAALTSERERALASGMDGFLTKPIDAQRLHDTLAETLARAR